MTKRLRLNDFATALSIVVAFGCLFFGRLIISRIATAEGTFLERVAARADSWDLGHRMLVVGAIALIPAALGLRRVFADRCLWLTRLATSFTVVGAILMIGQFALDFAILALAQSESPTFGPASMTLLRSNSFVDWAFYKGPMIGQIGLTLMAVVLWLQGREWRLSAVLVTLAAAVALIAPIFIGSTGERVALGVLFLGFTTVAWKIAFPMTSY